MSSLIDMLRAIIQQEMDARRQPEMALVLEVFPGDGNEGNHQADVRLRSSGVTLRRVPVTVPRPGLSLLPRVGDPVIVLFLNGDLAQPIVVGSIYSSDQQPPEAGPLEGVYMPPDDEESGVRRVHLETPSGGTVTLDDETLTVALGGTEMVIEQDGAVTITAASIAFTADGDITLDAGGDIAISASKNVTIEAQMNVEAKGSIGATLEGAATAKVKGAAVSLAGLTQFSAS